MLWTHSLNRILSRNTSAQGEKERGRLGQEPSVLLLPGDLARVSPWFFLTLMAFPGWSTSPEWHCLIRGSPGVGVGGGGGWEGCKGSCIMSKTGGKCRALGSIVNREEVSFRKRSISVTMRLWVVFLLEMILFPMIDLRSRSLENDAYYSSTTSISDISHCSQTI